MAKHNETGTIGEDIAVKFLINKGFSIIERNFRKKYGEIDIICKKDGITHFVEVKSVSQVTNTGSASNDSYGPEDNMHKNKQNRLKRVISVYISQNNIVNDISIDFITVKLDRVNNTAKLGFMKNIIL